MAVLEETGVEYSLHKVDFDAGEAQSPQYKKVQPLGLVPALGLAGSGSMFESAAIIQYLCDKHPESNLAPALHEPDRPLYLQWLFFFADTIYPSYNRYYHPQRYTAADDGAGGVKEQARQTMLLQWQVVEEALQTNGPWLLGHRFSACDIYLQMMTTWHETPGDLFSQFPRIQELAHGVVTRPRCMTAIQRHNFNTGFESDQGKLDSGI
jgi:glutathione S-transferase